ncbi:hypothetical protein [Pleionea sediminis]|uniref:hypothetical protein n=1 Tax=Pleionea sediminis TaxID=2569479 RepID=UPI001184F525|nr:hypothetical protein [Pleionea sediminis]
MILKIIILAALLKVLDVTGKPALCAGIYGGLVAILSLLSGYELNAILIVVPIVTIMSFLYFWLLDYFANGLAYWGIAIGGLIIGWI